MDEKQKTIHALINGIQANQVATFDAINRTSNALNRVARPEPDAKTAVEEKRKEPENLTDMLEFLRFQSEKLLTASENLLARCDRLF